MPDLDLSKFTKAKPAAGSKLNLSKFTKAKPVINDEEEISSLQKYSAMFVRGIAGFSPGGFPGMVAGGLAEGLAQTIEGRDEYNLGQIGTQAGLGAVPFGKAGSLIRSGMKGGLLGGGGTAITQQAEEGLHVPSREELYGIGAGTVLGGAGGAVGARLMRGGNVPEVKVADEIVPEVRIQPEPEPLPIQLPRMRTGTAFGPIEDMGPIDPSRFLQVPGKIVKKAKTKREVKIQEDGSAIDLETGEVIPKSRLTVEDSTKNVIAKGPKGQKALVAEVPVEVRFKNVPKGKKKLMDETGAIGDVGGARGTREAALIRKEAGDLIESLRRQRKEIPEHLYKQLISGTRGESGWAAKPASMGSTDAARTKRQGFKSEIGAVGDIAGLRARGDKAIEGIDSEVRKLVETLPSNHPAIRELRLTEPDLFTGPNAPIGKSPDPRFDTPTKGIGLKDLWKEMKVSFGREEGSLNVTLPNITPKVLLNSGKQVLAEARQAMTSMDLSFPLRQGIAMGTRKEFWSSFKPMLQAAMDEETFNGFQRELQSRPNAGLMKSVGLEMTELAGDVAKREEQLRGKWLEKLIPGIRASNRAYTTFANKLRADTFDRMLLEAKKAGGFNNPELTSASPTTKAIANFINDATGRGSLGRFEKSAVELNELLFSPKLIASRVNMLRRALQDPTMIATGVDNNVSKQLRKEAIRSMMGVGALAAMSVGISNLNDSEGTDDPRSTDFGKIKIGNTRIDLTGGFQQYIRVAAQIASGQTDTEGNVKDSNRAGIAGRFLRNKLSPAVSAIVDWAYGKDVIGNKVTVSSAIKSRITPLIIQDIQEIYAEDPEMMKFTTPLSLFGAGVQSYESGNSSSGSGPQLPKFPKVSLPKVR